MRTADGEGSKGRSNSTYTTAKLGILRGKKESWTHMGSAQTTAGSCV